MDELEHLLSQRIELCRQLDTLGEFRPGNLSRHQRKCGSPSCHCAKPDGHKHSSWQLTRKVEGKSRCRGIGEAELETTREQLHQYRLFQDWVRCFVELNESICEFRMKHGRRQKKTSPPSASGRSRQHSRPKRSTRS